MTSVRPFLVEQWAEKVLLEWIQERIGRLRLEPVIAGNPFKECSSKKEWRNRELIGGRSGASWFFFYDSVLICSCWKKGKEKVEREKERCRREERELLNPMHD